MRLLKILPSIVFVFPLLNAGSECSDALSAEKPLYVCDILGNLQKYRGRVVQVRAVMNHGLRPFAACEMPTITEGYKWPDAISAEIIREVPNVSECASSTRRDLTIRSFMEEERKAKVASPNITTVATFIGRILAREKYVRVQTNYGLLANGFGHLGAFAAAMEIYIVRDIERK